ncbi:MAG: Gfo/Idh/MocA family oxidoreductase [Candidatus Bathyarchaeia archaeon]|nr:Gfo/Idh/MocA family oxidoreductase [Candidatus Bathyarchaeota archaeon]
MGELGVAVIGAGFWGRNHVRVLSELPNVRLRAVCDVDRGRASELGLAYRIPYYTRLDMLLDRGDVEAVTVCTPTVTHFNVALKALRAGKHVLVEKPMTSTVGEAETLIGEAEDRGLTLAVGFIERFNPAVQYLKGLVEEGKLGRVILIMARRVSRWPERIGDVGVTKDSAIHDVDVMRYILGDEVETVYARMGSYQHRFEDWSEIMLQFKGGEVGFIDANWLTPRKIRTLIVTGSEATATLDYLTQEISIEDSEKTVKPKIKWVEPLKLELKCFTEAILEGRGEDLPTGSAGLEALKICEAALRSNAEGRPVGIR